MPAIPASVPRAVLRSRIPAKSPNAWGLVRISLLNMLALIGVGSVINPYLRELGMSPAFIGLYFSVCAVAQGSASFVGGFMADTFGRRRIWVAGKGFHIGVRG